MKRKIMSIIGAGLAITIICAGCTSGLGGYGVGSGNTPTGTVVDLDSIDGSTDVAVDSKFQYTFSRDVDTSTVTTSTFFILPAPVANIASPLKGAYDSGVCDVTSALPATVDCYTGQKCVLTPSNSLSPGTSYTICLTPAILYAGTPSLLIRSAYAADAFAGATIQFTTAAAGTSTYTIGGTVAGLSAGETLVLQNNSADDLTITADGSFTFATAVADGGGYEVTVLTEPADKTCTVSDGTGTVSGADVTNVSVVCVLARWARSVTAGAGSSYFNGVSVDASGNIYAVGDIGGTGAFGFGDGVTATGTVDNDNVVIVKYNSSGTAQWAKSVTAGASESYFNGVSVDVSGNIYAVGLIGGNGAYNFGTGVINGIYADGPNVVIVKYNSSGTAQWAKTVTAGASDSYFNGVSVDTSGNAYAVGLINGNGEFDFGDGVTATGAVNGNNVVILKYDSSGTAQWAKTVTEGVGISEFYGVFADTSGNIYAVGYIRGDGAFGFGDGVTATGTSDDADNVVIVKYNSGGTAQWAKTTTAGAGESQFSGVSVDTSGNAYAVGYIDGNGAYNFGTGVINGIYADGPNVVIVKYNSSGTAQWAKTVTAGENQSDFNGVSVDASGNAYAVGYITGNGNYNFGSGVIHGTATEDSNVVVVKYNSSGTAQWAKSVTAGVGSSDFSGVSVDTSGDIYAVGYIEGSGAYTFEDGVTATGAYADDSNVVIVKYKAE